MKLLAVGVPLLFVLLSANVFSQSTPRIEFDVASVKLSPASNGHGFTESDIGGPGSATPGRWSCEYYSLRDLLGKAFGLNPAQISGPVWLENQRFHIDARLAETTTREQFREMLRNLLKDRFALAAQLELRSMPQYELTVAMGGPKLQRSVDRPPPPNAPKALALDADGFPVLGPPSSEPEIVTIHGHTRMFFPSTAVGDLVEELVLKLGSPVIDLTGLNGKYDIGLQWIDGDSALDLTAALRDQLGLRLAEKKGPVQLLVVQHIEKLPTGN